MKKIRRTLSSGLWKPPQPLPKAKHDYTYAHIDFQGKCLDRDKSIKRINYLYTMEAKFYTSKSLQLCAYCYREDIVKRLKKDGEFVGYACGMCA
jgi:hypothetical protein